MILYSNQLIKLNSYDEPAIFIGYDKQSNTKIWVVCIDHNNKPELDWFNESAVDYYSVHTANKATPKGTSIFFGKFKGGFVNGTMSEKPTDEEIEKYGAYVMEMMEKYKTKEK